jgi:ATP-dependent Lon protease
MSDLDNKINQHFAGLAVRKDLVASIKGNAVVPSYVLEYLLGQHCATEDADTIAAGLEQVKNILASHFVQRSESSLIKSRIEQKGRYKVIDKVSFKLNETYGYYEASFTNLEIYNVPAPTDYIRKHPKLLTGGVWSIVDVSYEVNDDPKGSPWGIEDLKPIQVSKFDFENYLDARRKFSTEEWMGMLTQTVGFNPEMVSRRGILLLLSRLIAFCERNYNMIELGPKGTGKSHIFSEFSPHGFVISGSEITSPKLFVSNVGKGKVGLVGHWDCICFDEFAGKDKKVQKALVDQMKNYMAQKTFSRGVEQMGAEASMVFMGNTKKSLPYMLKHTHLYEQLPDKYIDSAFLDRIHAYLPGWEVSPIQNELFSNGYGLIVDYLAEILRHMRTLDFTNEYKKYFEINSDLTTRDVNGVQKTFSGLMKILYPNREATEAEIHEILSFAVECRKRAKVHIVRIDETFEHKEFMITHKDGTEENIQCAEELQYPELFEAGCKDHSPAPLDEDLPLTTEPVPLKAPTKGNAAPTPEAGHLVVPENVKGYSYDRLFKRHLEGATEIVIRDPYIRAYWQVRNCLELLQLVNSMTEIGEEVKVHLITQSDMDSCVRQDESLKQVQDSCDGSRVAFTYEFDSSSHFHARSITTDTGWKITLDRGLDIFQKSDLGGLSLAGLSQEERLQKGCEVTYIRE